MRICMIIFVAYLMSSNNLYAQPFTLYKGYGQAVLLNNKRIDGHFHAWGKTVEYEDEDGHISTRNYYFLTFDKEGTPGPVDLKPKEVLSMEIGGHQFENFDGNLMYLFRDYKEIKLYHHIWGAKYTRYKDRRLRLSNVIAYQYSYIATYKIGGFIVLKNKQLWKQWFKKHLIDGTFPIDMKPYFDLCKHPGEYIQVLDRYLLN